MITTEELIARSQAGDTSSTEQLLNENTGLIWAVVKRFMGRGTDADDLYQLGCLGLLKAIEGFDPNYGTQFSTYAVPKITGEIRRFLRDDGAIKVSRTIKERAATIKSERSRLMNILGREPTLAEISDQTGISVEDIATAESATAGIESLYRESGDEGFSLENILSDTESEDSLLEKISLKQAIGILPEKEATVIKLRYFHALTQERISRILCVSQVQVSRIEKKALQRLRDQMK